MSPLSFRQGPEQTETPADVLANTFGFHSPLLEVALTDLSGGYADGIQPAAIDDDSGKDKVLPDARLLDVEIGLSEFVDERVRPVGKLNATHGDHSTAAPISREMLVAGSV
jgi:hypothetical protein